MNVFYDKDCKPEAIADKKFAVLGYGSQGHAHALNLKDSGLQVRVGLRKDSKSVTKAKNAGLEVGTIDEVCKWADRIMVLLPDETQSEVFQKEIEPHLEKGKGLLFAHGFNIHFKQIEPQKNIPVYLIAPKGPGHLVRSSYEQNSGVPCLVAVHQDPDGNALQEAMAYAQALGGGRSGIIETTFREETETDLFGEQVVLCGGLTSLIKAGFETLVEAGYAPEMAYFECLHEVKLIVDLLYQGGITDMRYSISNTAQYGDITRGPRLINEDTKARMTEILAEIQSGEFAAEWMKEYKSGLKNFNRLTKMDEDHKIEQIGKKLRNMMPWISKGKMVDREKN